MYNLHKATTTGLRVLIPIILNVLDTAEVQGTFGTVEKNLKRLRKLKFCVPNFSANKHFQKKNKFRKRYLSNLCTNGSVENTVGLCFAFQLHDPNP